MKKYFCIATVVSMLASPPVVAQQTTRPGPNGGFVAGSAGHLIELVLRGQDVSVYSLEADKPVAVDKAKMRLVVQQDGKTENSDLTPADATRLSTRLAFAPARGALIVVSGRDNHGHSVSARFVVPDSK